MYRGTEAYDFSLFEPMVAEQPKKMNKADEKKTPVKKAVPKKVAATKNTKSAEYTVERNALSAAVPSAVKKAITFCVVCFAMMVVLLVMETKCDTLMSDIAQVQSEIDIAEGENVRLNAELNSMMSSDKVESYAENVLGMVKAENYQISYIDLSEGDEIVVSGDKTADSEEETNMLKALLAYIF